ncbi:hypothetical protein BU16DRAFT_566622 [Lophium mytilinum]|uniref:Uncharacterized protein n=1 Tax=Lophium mytilinum TaxID=390894 RepID=A0A6A6QF15_9PEZI|nr:hypothetical protein BU16DRAFT_566622 [Lophium mytilinum]
MSAGHLTFAIERFIAEGCDSSDASDTSAVSTGSTADQTPADEGDRIHGQNLIASEGVEQVIAKIVTHLAAQVATQTTADVNTDAEAKAKAKEAEAIAKAKMAAFLLLWQDPDRVPPSLDTIPQEILFNIVGRLATPHSLDDGNAGTASLPANPRDPSCSSALYNLHVTSTRYYDLLERFVYSDVALNHDIACKSFLAKLLKDPSIGHYVRRLEFMTNEIPLIPSHALGHFIDHLGLSSAALLNSVQLQGTNINLTNLLQTANPSAQLGIILMLTPNLQTLLLNGSAFMDPMIRRNDLRTLEHDQVQSPHAIILKDISLGRAVFTRSNLTVQHSFRALKNVSICMDGIPIANLTAIFALPSIRHFAGFGLFCLKEYDNTACHVPQSSSGIITLSLKGFYAGMDNYEALVQGCKHLEELDIHVPYTAEDINVHRLCRIGSHHKKSLRLLGLDFYSPTPNSLQDLGDLNTFPQLGTLHLPPMAIAWGPVTQPMFLLAEDIPMCVKTVDLTGYSAENDLEDLPFRFAFQLERLAILWAANPWEERYVYIHASALGRYYLGTLHRRIERRFNLSGASLMVNEDPVDF